MFTGIIQATAHIAAIDERLGLRTFHIEFPAHFCHALAVGASVAVNGVCLTVTQIPSPTRATFDVMQQTLDITTLGKVAHNARVNVERSAKEGAEIGGHILSGHVDGTGTLLERRVLENNLVWRIAVPEPLRRYVFARGYIAIEGASLTVAEVNRSEGWLEVWLIPETRRATVFEERQVGDKLNIEIERNTQVMVDTIYAAVHESVGPALHTLLAAKI